MLNDVKKLYDLGFAIHLLRSKSKLPIEAGWTTGERKTWVELERAFKRSPSANVGVRLGTPSKLQDGTYLTAIDCDVKSPAKHHIEEMRHELGKLGIKGGPIVLSGRGNGSMHVYVRTTEPIPGRRLSQSKDKAKVHMPSVPPSNSDRKALSIKEIEAGYRFRPAWEIGSMGDGRQIVLPPSIHPDTGKPYRWKNGEPEHFESFPLYEEASVQTTPNSESVLTRFKPEIVDLALSDLDPRMVAMIERGEAVEDRSAALLVSSIAMLKAGFTENEVLTVLTDRDNFLGTAAFDHAKTENRDRAARWLMRYTMPRARLESPQWAFPDTIEEGVPLSAQASAAQSAEVTAEDWRHKLERCGGEDSRIKPTLQNLVMVLQNAVSPHVFKRDDFAGSEVLGVTPPWGGETGAEVRDIDIVNIKLWFAQRFRIEPATDKLNEAVAHVGHLNRFHPVRDYLDSLKWDGKPRLSTWLARHFSAEAPEPYLSEVSTKTLTALVSRIYEPGCKFDHVLILEGKQGCGKSTGLRILTSPWFSDAAIDIRDKDAVLALKSVWLLELGELGGMRHAEAEAMKEFISRQTDRMRLPYGKRAENFPRQCTFIGSTNQDEYLKDTTGNRRFWPVTVGAVDFDGLRRERHQLWAEAVVSYRIGERLYLERGIAADQATDEQASRQISDEWVNRIQAFFSAPVDGFDAESFNVGDLFGPAGPLAEWKPNRAEQMRASDALKVLGCTRSRKREGGRQFRTWSVPRLSQVVTRQDDDI